MDERRTEERADEPDRGNRPDKPPPRPITEWPREAEEKGGDETPGVGQPPG